MYITFEKEFLYPPDFIQKYKPKRINSKTFSIDIASSRPTKKLIEDVNKFRRDVCMCSIKKEITH